MNERPYPAAGSPTPVQGRCGAKLRNSDPPRYCTQHPISGRERCYFHGGRTPRGMASPHFKHGMKTKDYGVILTKATRQRYRAALDDPDVLSLRKEVALLRAWVMDVVEDGHHGEGGSWKEVTAAWEDFEAATRAADQPGQIAALARVRDQIRAGTAKEAARAEAVKLTTQLEKLTRSEREREVELFQMITAEEALSYMRAMALAVRESVTRFISDAEVRTAVLAALASRFAQLTGGRGASRLGAGEHPDAEAVDPPVEQ